MGKPPEAEKEITREQRLKSFTPIPPGYFAVFYEVKKKAMTARMPVVGWAVYEREEFHGDGKGPSTRVLRDVVEAMVLTNVGEAELVGDYYPVDDDGHESFRLLGIAIPGDTTDWHAEMERDAEFVKRSDEITRELAEKEERQQPKVVPTPPKRGAAKTKFDA